MSGRATVSPPVYDASGKPPPPKVYVYVTRPLLAISMARRHCHDWRASHKEEGAFSYADPVL